jgi:hypothetical protein
MQVTLANDAEIQFLTGENCRLSLVMLASGVAIIQITPL